MILYNFKISFEEVEGGFEKTCLLTNHSRVIVVCAVLKAERGMSASGRGSRSSGQVWATDDAERSRSVDTHRNPQLSP